MITILAIDDEIEQLNLLNQFLGHNYNVIGKTYVGSIKDLIRSTKPELIIIDKHLKPDNGLEIIKQIRCSEYSNIPVILITGDGDDESLAEALAVGADDFIAKPFSFKQLESRLIARLRRRGILKSEKKIHFNDLTIDLTEQTYYLGDKELNLSPIEKQILIRLVKQSDTLVRRDLLINTSHIQGHTKDLALNVHIHSIRRKLGNLGQHINTVRNQGYILHTFPQLNS